MQAPMPSCTAFCMPLRKPIVPPHISHRRAIVGFILAGRERHTRDRLDPDEMVPHTLDTGNIFRGDDQACAFSIVSNHAMQFSYAAVDDHVDARRPILLPNRGKDLVANCQIPAGRRYGVTG